MKLLRGLQHLSVLSRGSVATIGNFDGVHLGHQALLRQLRSHADRLQLPLVVMIFEPQPGEYFQKSQAPARLTSLREKLQVLQTCGVDYVFCLKFNPALASMSAVEFAERYLFSELCARYLLIGEDFRFGQGRAGDVVLLQDLGQKHACRVETFPDFFVDTQRVSSTKIRQLLQQSALNQVRKLLGRPYRLCGRVIKGDGRGRQWGIPTANVRLQRTTLPLRGVFCVNVLRDGKPLLKGVANIGYRPTVDGLKHSLEVHLFDVDEALYGERLQVIFLHQLRDEIKFSSVDDLIAAIHNDIANAKKFYEVDVGF